MYVAVEGCGHGELDAIYDALRRIETAKSIRISLLIICGDFQAVRNENDLQCMAVPQKYYAMGTFYKYYSGQLVAPVLTLVIGGNHEASNYLQQLAYGGWLAPRIYYAGYASVLRFGSVRIAAQSGIYKHQDYYRGHYERPPYTAGSMRSAYHVRELDTFRLKQLTGDIDVFLSHDWPRGIYHHGNLQQLLRKKPFFKDEISSNQLGSPAGEELLSCLRPSYWLAAHLHVKFAALVQHSTENLDTSQSNRSTTNSTPAKRFTRFLALDKCLPKKRYLQVLEFPDSPPAAADGAPSTGDLGTNAETSAISNQLGADPYLSYDLEWLTVLRLTDHLLSVSPSSVYMPGRAGSTDSERYDFRPSAEEMAATRAIWCSSSEAGSLAVPNNFTATVSPYNGSANIRGGIQPAASTDPQTTEFCCRLGIRDPMALLLSSTTASTPHSLNSTSFNSPGSCNSSRFRRLQLPSPANSSSCSAATLPWSEPASPASILLTSLDSTTDHPSPGSADEADDQDDGMFVIDRRGSLSSQNSSVFSPPPMLNTNSLLDSPGVAHTSTPVAPPRSRAANCSRTRLKLPAPTGSSPQKPRDEEVAVVTAVSDGVVGETGNCRTDQLSDTPTTEVPTKKFKRRNHALYTSTDE